MCNVHYIAVNEGINLHYHQNPLKPRFRLLYQGALDTCTLKYVVLIHSLSLSIYISIPLSLSLTHSLLLTSVNTLHWKNAVFEYCRKIVVTRNHVVGWVERGVDDCVYNNSMLSMTYMWPVIVCWNWRQYVWEDSTEALNITS